MHPPVTQQRIRCRKNLRFEGAVSKTVETGFLRRVINRRLLKWGQCSTRRSCRPSKPASSLDRSNSATTLTGLCHSPLSSDLSRPCSQLLQVDVPDAFPGLPFLRSGGERHARNDVSETSERARHRRQKRRLLEYSDRWELTRERKQYDHDHAGRDV